MACICWRSMYSRCCLLISVSAAVLIFLRSSSTWTSWPEIAVQQPQRLAARRRFEQSLLAGHVEAEHRAEQVGEAQRILRLGDQLLDVDRHLHLGQLQHAGGQVDDGAIQRLDFGAVVLRLRQRLHARLEERLGLLGSQQADALDALDDQLDDAFAARHLLDDGAGADR